MLNISEIFYSIQGEIDVGKPTVFIRTAGCNMNPKCKWCDSKFSWNNGKQMTNKQIYEKIKKYNCEYVVFTGGEPTLQLNEISKLISYLYLKNPNMNFGIETNGLNYDETVLYYFNNISISPKYQKYNINALKKYSLHSYVRFKFVFNNNKWFESIIKKCKIKKDNVWIMPEGATRELQFKRMNKVINYCKLKGYNFSPRLHSLVWDNMRKK